jgi:hypothetical protein
MRVVLTDSTGHEWANACSLCNDQRKVGPDREFECPWCRGVRMKYGNYWYPVDASNQHLHVGRMREKGEPK